MNRQNPPIQQNCGNFWTNHEVLVSFEIYSVLSLWNIVDFFVRKSYDRTKQTKPKINVVTKHRLNTVYIYPFNSKFRMEYYVAFTFWIHAYLNFFVKARHTCVHCLDNALHNAQCSTLHFTTLYLNPLHFTVLNQNTLHFMRLYTQTISFQSNMLTILLRFCNISMIYLLYCH